MLHLIHSGQEGNYAPIGIAVHLFSVENDASLREPPLLDVSLKLLAQFMADGFLTANEPVLIRLKDWGFETFSSLKF